MQGSQQNVCCLCILSCSCITGSSIATCTCVYFSCHHFEVLIIQMFHALLSASRFGLLSFVETCLRCQWETKSSSELGQTAGRRTWDSGQFANRHISDLLWSLKSSARMAILRVRQHARIRMTNFHCRREQGAPTHIMRESLLCYGRDAALTRLDDGYREYITASWGAIEKASAVEQCCCKPQKTLNASFFLLYTLREWMLECLKQVSSVLSYVQ